MNDDQQSLPITVIVCRRGQRAKGKCSIQGCTRPHTKLCDFPLKGRKAGHTCDAKLCDEHATHMGPDKDYCPPHVALARKESR